MNPPPPESDHRPRLLIVDDDAAALRLLAVALASQNFEVLTAISGEEALGLIEATPPDIVVLDVEMPGLSGTELCQRLRGSEITALKELPVIMLTAHGAEADEVRCFESGANDFVTKPVSRAVLQARIQTQLRLRAYARQLEEWRAVQEADLTSARATQRALVPEEPPRLPGWDVRARFSPLIQVGGDIYGWESLDDGRWLVWLCDSTGHGAAAALTTALTAHLFHQAARGTNSPAKILTAVDRDFRRVVGGNVFMTACCAAIAADGAMTFSSAGHPPILIHRRGGGVEAHLPDRTILGLGETPPLEETNTVLDAGDIALLYTDGLYSMKAGDDARMSHQIVEQCLAAGPLGPDPIEELLTRIRTRSNGAPPTTISPSSRCGDFEKSGGEGSRTPVWPLEGPRLSGSVSL